MENIAVDLNLLADDLMLDDTFDELLASLPTVKPPVDFVAHVMDVVLSLPAHKPALISPWGDLDQVMVLNDRTRLS